MLNRIFKSLKEFWNRYRFFHLLNIFTVLVLFAYFMPFPGNQSLRTKIKRWENYHIHYGDRVISDKISKIESGRHETVFYFIS